MPVTSQVISTSRFGPLDAVASLEPVRDDYGVSIRDDLPAKMRAARLSAGLTQEKVALKMAWVGEETSVKRITDWENGRSFLDLDKFYAWCLAVGASADTILGLPPVVTGSEQAEGALDLGPLRGAIERAVEGLGEQAASQRDQKRRLRRAAGDPEHPD